MARIGHIYGGRYAKSKKAALQQWEDDGGAI
jgi:hypothetical protein